jgi:PucR family transcriptional regulator, proline-responsive transcriptional activator
MALILKSSYQLLDGMLEEGLPFVAAYLQKLINRSIIIIDNHGSIHYPEIMQHDLNPDVEFILPMLTSDLQVHYDKPSHTLYYPIRNNKPVAMIIVERLSINHVAQTAAILGEAQLALKCYFSNFNRSNKDKDDFEQLIKNYLFKKTNTNIIDVIHKSQGCIDMKIPYFIAMMKMDKIDMIDELESISPFSKQYFKNNQLDVIQLTCPDCLLFIIPANPENEGFPINPSDISLTNLTRYKQALENKFCLSLSLGIGQVYPALSLRKSFKEAQITLILNQLLEKESFIQEFKQLGIYYFIFSQDLESVHNYCMNILGPIIQHDNATGNDLLDTLRKILDCNFNLKSAADKLVLHVNSVHYRLDKIEQLLNTDLSDIRNRIDYYVALKVWDTLRTTLA